MIEQATLVELLQTNASTRALRFAEDCCEQGNALIERGCVRFGSLVRRNAERQGFTRVYDASIALFEIKGG